MSKFWKWYVFRLGESSLIKRPCTQNKSETCVWVSICRRRLILAPENRPFNPRPPLRLRRINANPNALPLLPISIPFAPQTSSKTAQHKAMLNKWLRCWTRIPSNPTSPTALYRLHGSDRSTSSPTQVSQIYTSACPLLAAPAKFPHTALHCIALRVAGSILASGRLSVIPSLQLRFRHADMRWKGPVQLEGPFGSWRGAGNYKGAFDPFVRV